MGLARNLALNAYRPLGRLALPFLRPRSDAPPPWDTGADPDALLAVAFSARDPGARRRAAARIEALWDGEPERRKVIWWQIRERLTSPFGPHGSDRRLSGWTEVAGDGSAGVPRSSRIGIWRSGSRVEDRIHVPEAIERFLFGPDPDCPRVPRIRLVTGLALGAASDATLLLDLALRADDPALRGRCAAVVAETDEPHVLDALEHVFSQAFDFWLNRRTVRGELILGQRPELWSDDGTPTPLLSLLLSNPHVPRPPGAESDATSYSGVLAALHGRFDLLAGFPPGLLIHQMLMVTEDRPGTPADAACRRALRALDEGPAREILCQAAMEDEDNDAVAAVTDAGYLPADPDLVPLFLMLTRQWERFAAADPDGHRLRDYIVREDTVRDDYTPSFRELVWMLEQDARPHAATAQNDPIPDDAREHALAALRAIGPGAVGNRLCAMALDGVDVAVRVVADTGLVPVPGNPRDLAVFLYRTRQWDRYDAADPDGRHLRDHVERLGPYDDERTKLRDAAERGGRPMPCGPRSEPPRPAPYRPSGTGVAGTGGFIGGFTTH